ncbi:hypothetical protein [Aquabacterium sp. J223]|uniref:hypothetical protein n=1 Tax=Aquabacterium sp. J223 TaxID=2898431 RepID=UPI0021AD83ED|nr:hypothetical protein [Aquabacterium sp. J223]UUX97728.1 hypothetical protein LRS07_11135 [Aquabacterium sp. J223]
MNSPNPALVSQRAVQRLPRLALLAFCAAYVLPGLFGRDPWKAADLTAFGYMVEMAAGRTGWLSPTLGGLPVDTAVLPHWLGALAIALLSPWVDPALAARLPFGLLLVGVLALTWYSCFHFGRTPAAQPLPFAFGGEAHPVDYARAVADGAVLALIASLGLLQLGHETTPELVQLFAVALLLWSLAVDGARRWRARLAVLVALPLLATSGAPSMALAMGALATALCLNHRAGPTRRAFAPWVGAATLLALAAAAQLHTWQLRLALPGSADDWLRTGRLLLWFLWPLWLLALWTLWQWRRRLGEPHLGLPLATTGVGLVSTIAMGGSDRALMLALPGMAVLAAFALPTLRRSTAAAMDWFSVFFFTACAITIWVIYVALMTGVPAKPAANVARLAPDFVARFSPLELLVALVGTAAWLALVRWRTGRHRQALWKSLVLPAGGVGLCWLLLLTLWLPLLDHARSLRPWVQRLQLHWPADGCLAAPGLGRPTVAALVHFGRREVDAVTPAERTACPVLLLAPGRAAPPGWRRVAQERRPTDRNDVLVVYRRADDRRRAGPAR